MLLFLPVCPSSRFVDIGGDYDCFVNQIGYHGPGVMHRATLGACAQVRKHGVGGNLTSIKSWRCSERFCSIFAQNIPQRTSFEEKKGQGPASHKSMTPYLPHFHSLHSSPATRHHRCVPAASLGSRTGKRRADGLM